MPAHDFQERLLELLAEQPFRFFNAREISSLLRDQHPLAKNPDTVQKHLAILADASKIERTPMNSYRHKQKRSMSIAPSIADVLQKSGQSFSWAMNGSLVITANEAESKAEGAPSMNSYRHKQKRSMSIAPSIADALRKSGRSFSGPMNESLGITANGAESKAGDAPPTEQAQTQRLTRQDSFCDPPCNCNRQCQGVKSGEAGALRDADRMAS